jgi:hypothetical protein
MGASNWGMVWTAVMPLAVILYYFFRKKYKDQRVSSTLFWQERMKELQASPYLKKLQHHLLFYLQLAALLLCVLGLMGPFSESETLAGNDFIFVVDTSATMLAGSPTHFEKHRQDMKDLAALAGGKPVTIVTTGESPEVAVRNEQDLERIEQAIDGLLVSYENAEMEQAILFADTLASGESTVIHIFTDALDRAVLANKTGQSYQVHGIAETLNNVAIRQFGLSETENGVRGIVQLVNNSVVLLVSKSHKKMAIIAPIIATIRPGILRVAAVICNLPVSNRVAIVPPIKAPTIPNIIVAMIPPP